MIDEQGRAVGLVSTAQVQSLPAGARPERSIGLLATSDPELLVALVAPAVDVMQAPAFVRTGRAVVLDDGRHPVGVLSVTDV